MANDSGTFIRIGVECESLEGDSWGVSRIVRKLLEQLAARPELARTHRFHLYFKKSIPDLPFLKNAVFVPTVTTPRGIPASFNFHYHVWMVARAYRDGVRALYLPAYQLPLLWFKKSLVMLTEDVWREMRNPKMPFRYRLSYSIFATWAARSATRVMAISHASAAGISHLFGIAPDRIAVNQLAVDAPRTDVPSVQKTYVLWVGQAFERRHLREALAAFAEVAHAKPDLQFRIIGPDKYEPAIIGDTVRRINAQLERTAVSWDQHVSDEDLAHAYAGARALVYVSDTEAFGLPPLEALSYGALPIVADVPVTREVYGEHAFYASEPTPHGIGEAMRAALSYGQRGEAIKQAAPGILERYTWKAHADRFLGIMAELTA